MPAAIVPTDPRTEYAVEPIGVDEPAPRFSWSLAGGDQEGSEYAHVTAYQIVVATSPDQVAVGSGTVWDSGRVASARTEPVAYGGPELASDQEYHWSVRLWDAAGNSSPWLPPARFETAPASPAAGGWADAVWICRDLPEVANDPTVTVPAPLLRHEWRLDQHPDQVVRARLAVAGLGYVRTQIDGVRVGDAVLDPAPTDYDHTVLYTVHDVTGLVRSGRQHLIGAELGRGRYAEPTPNVWFWHTAPWKDQPKLLLCLTVTYGDGHRQHVVSDSSWLAVDGPTRFDSLYAGERYDARVQRPEWTAPGAALPDWQPVRLAEPPRGRLRAQQIEPMRVAGEIAPIAITEPRPGTFVVDFGQQLAGWAVLRVDGEPGTEVRLTYGEKLHPDGTVHIDQVHIEHPIQTDSYVLAGGDVEEFEPSWSYKGFQYVQLDGFPGRPTTSSLSARPVHTAVASTGELETDDERVNRLHTGVRWAILNNLHGVPTDTPVYEKNGWSGDAQLMASTMALNFDMARFFTKWMQDWFDAQRPSGEFPPIVPSAGWGFRGTDSGIIGPIPAWDIACVEIPWVLFCVYGDRRMLRRAYDPARRYLDYLTDGFLESDDVIRIGLGDYLPPGSGGVPPEGPGIYETAYAVRFAQRLARIAGVLAGESGAPGDDDVDAAGDQFRELADRLTTGLNRVFLDSESGTYHGENPTGYRQSANVVPLALGITPESERGRVLGNLIADIHARDDHLDTGVIGTKLLLPLLTRAGQVDLAYTVAMRRSYPGYGFWLEQGSTALYEMWHADSRSRNHHFFGTVDQWLYQDVVGLVGHEPDVDPPGVRVVRPHPPSALTRARASIRTPQGRLAASWERQGDGLRVQLDVPAGLRVRVELPDGGTERRQTVECGPGRHIVG